MAASAVGPPTGVPATLVASLGRDRFVVTLAAKVANIPSSKPAPLSSDGGRRRRQLPAGGLQTEQPAETRLFDAAESFGERDANSLLGSKNRVRFADCVRDASDDRCPMLSGDVVPYHMPYTVQFGSCFAGELAWLLHRLASQVWC